MKFSIKDLVTFTEEILNGKLHSLCSDDIVLRFTKRLKTYQINHNSCFYFSSTDTIVILNNVPQRREPVITN